MDILISFLDQFLWEELKRSLQRRIYVTVSSLLINIVVYKSIVKSNPFKLIVGHTNSEPMTYMQQSRSEENNIVKKS